jgi:hypothetical protein
MKIVAFITGLIVTCVASISGAQVPAVLGTWKYNAQA